MARYFTREEAEALLPQVSVILRTIQREHAAAQEYESELAELEKRARGNGHHLHERIAKLQQALTQNTQIRRALIVELLHFGCELKDPETGLIDFLGLRDGREIYLCWRLGETGINYWHELHTGFAGRQPF
ncbi:MAG TPA: DUF2203 domain-containing protein [Ktedonobacteraceae bacterium]